MQDIFDHHAQIVRAALIAGFTVADASVSAVVCV